MKIIITACFDYLHFEGGKMKVQKYEIWKRNKQIGLRNGNHVSKS